MLRTAAGGVQGAAAQPAVLAGGTQAFYRMTLGNARALSLDDRIGSVEAGKEADLVVLDFVATRYGA